MKEVEAKIKETARRLLADGTVELVLGYEAGSVPLRSTPCFARTAADADRLVWDGTCENNLARYLVKRPGKTAVVAKGCDSRALVALMRENRFTRDQVYIIGVPCTGMIDRHKVAGILAGRELVRAAPAAGRLVLEGRGFTESVELSQVRHETCATCRHPNPVLYDVLAGEEVPVRDAPRYARVEALERLTAAERDAWFAREMAKCIRCYACRQACPMCYCTECFADCTRPVWTGKTNDPGDTLLFHAGRAYHLAGRCVECGACDRACPMGVDQFLLIRKINKDVEDLYGYEAGLKVEDTPALATFNPDDPQAFLVE